MKKVQDDWAKALESALVRHSPPAGAKTTAELAEQLSVGMTRAREIARSLTGKTLERGKFGNQVYYWPKKK